jgi:tetratricopeptide (TPR) repeat protein
VQFGLIEKNSRFDKSAELGVGRLKNRNWGAFLSITLAISLVVLPILLERLPGLRARWALARAANAVDLGDGDAKQLLRAASQQFSDPKQELDYWHVRLKMALKTDNDTAIRVLYEAAAVNENFRTLAINAFVELEKRRDFKNALEALVLYYIKTSSKKLDAEILNQLAYLRALAQVDLENALQDIDQALKNSPSRWEYRDTRAWILFQLGRLPEALEEANAAVKGSGAELKESETGILNQLMSRVNGIPQPVSKDGLLTREEAGPLLWSAGVIRYHRGKILEALGKAAEAEVDWLWLAERKLPADERLH